MRQEKQLKRIGIIEVPERVYLTCLVLHHLEDIAQVRGLHQAIERLPKVRELMLRP
ncbi:hypothetical protein MYX84_14850 [Acidobacteria bacterium AH-259-O06]|nr:hypothetical protein [Acidobacteria bacterium AH-259-O06]